MDATKLASGDSNLAPISPRSLDENRHYNTSKEFDESSEGGDTTMEDDGKSPPTDITPQIIDENEIKLKERMAQCRNIIHSLKLELNEEKTKLEKESKLSQKVNDLPYSSGLSDFPGDDDFVPKAYSSNVFGESMDSKLICDQNLIEYEKQLQKYQTTLNIAQMEKKNAIRKQMLAKAYKLKLLEVENQCNIELLRVKQSLQCLEPLKMMANKWKNGESTDSNYDFNNFELLPMFPDLNASSACDMSPVKDIECGNDKKTSDKNENIFNSTFESSSLD